MDLRHLLPLLGTPAFAPAVRRELAGMYAVLPLGRGCESGGFPDPSSLGIGEPEVAVEEDFVAVRFGASFTERVVSGCGGAPQERHRLVDCRLRIDRRTGRGEVGAVPDDREPEPEF